MWLYLLFLLGLLYLSKRKEGLTIHVDAENIYDTVHRYTLSPIYRSMLYFIPFKHHYRKARRYFKSS